MRPAPLFSLLAALSACDAPAPPAPRFRPERASPPPALDAALQRPADASVATALPSPASPDAALPDSALPDSASLLTPPPRGSVAWFAPEVLPADQRNGRPRLHRLGLRRDAEGRASYNVDGLRPSSEWSERCDFPARRGEDFFQSLGQRALFDAASGASLRAEVVLTGHSSALGCGSLLLLRDARGQVLHARVLGVPIAARAVRLFDGGDALEVDTVADGMNIGGTLRRALVLLYGGELREGLSLDAGSFDIGPCDPYADSPSGLCQLGPAGSFSVLTRSPDATVRAVTRRRGRCSGPLEPGPSRCPYQGTTYRLNPATGAFDALDAPTPERPLVPHRRLRR